MAVEVSADSVIAKFPHKKLTTVRGEPTHASVTKAEKELGANLIADRGQCKAYRHCRANVIVLPNRYSKYCTAYRAKASVGPHGLLLVTWFQSAMWTQW